MCLKLKVSDSPVKTSHLSAGQMLSKAFLHLSVARGAERNLREFSYCQLQLSLNILSATVITQIVPVLVKRVHKSLNNWARPRIFFPLICWKMTVGPPFAAHARGTSGENSSSFIRVLSVWKANCLTVHDTIGLLSIFPNKSPYLNPPN